MVGKGQKPKQMSQVRKKRAIAQRHRLTAKSKTNKKRYKPEDDILFMILGLGMSIPLIGGGILFIIFIGFVFWKLLFG